MDTRKGTVQNAERECCEARNIGPFEGQSAVYLSEPPDASAVRWCVGKRRSPGATSSEVTVKDCAQGGAGTTQEAAAHGAAEKSPSCRSLERGESEPVVALVTHDRSIVDS